MCAFSKETPEREQRAHDEEHPPENQVGDVEDVFDLLHSIRSRKQNVIEDTRSSEALGVESAVVTVLTVRTIRTVSA
jgi:hypothetical protein